MATAKSTKESKETTLEKKAEEAALMSFDYGEDEGGGHDPDSAGDIRIPYVMVLQSGSPQVKRGGIEGAEEGMLYNNVTEELSDSIRFIPVISRKSYEEWTTRDEGGGFIASHGLSSDIVQKFKAGGDKGPWKTNNGKNEIIETVKLYCIVVDEQDSPTGEFFILSFTSTKLSTWAKFNGSVRTLRIPRDKSDPRSLKIKPPLFAHVVKLTSRLQKNKYGEFYNFLLSPANGAMKDSLLLPGSEGITGAKEFRKMVDSGAAQAVQEQREAPASRSDDDDGEDAF